MSRRACSHRVLAFIGRNAGVGCVACGRTWRRVRRVISKAGHVTVSRLVASR